MTTHLETERLILRNIQQSDAPGIYELDSDPEVHKYLGEKPIPSFNEAEEIVKYIQGQYTKYGIGRWAIIEKETGEFVGWGGLKYETEVRLDRPYYDLGYRLIKRFWGKGIATEVSEASLKYGFITMNLNEICAGAHVDNIGSNRVLEKVGFNFIETFMYDNLLHTWYSISKEDWIQHTNNKD